MMPARSIGLLSLASAVVLLASLSPAAAPTPIAFTNATVIDGTGAAPQPGMTLVVTGNRITALGRRARIRVPKDARLVDARGKFLVPGLWDMHVHLFEDGSSPGVRSGDAGFSLLVANGVVGVRDLSTGTEDAGRIRTWRGSLEEGTALVPRIVGGHPVDGNPAAWPDAVSVSTPEEGREVVARLQQAGAEFIAVHSQLSRDAYFAMAVEARSRQLPFAGDVPHGVKAAEASNAGQKSIEHLHGVLLACSLEEAELMRQWKGLRRVLDTFNAEKAEELFATFKRNGTWHTPTLRANRALASLDDRTPTAVGRSNGVRLEDRRQWDPRVREGSAETAGSLTEWYDRELQVVGAMHRAGVRLLAGSDLGHPSAVAGAGLHDELVLLVEAGLSPLDAIRTATQSAAMYLGLQDSLGTLQMGKLADLVVLEADPSKDIRNLQRIDSVMINGRLIDRAVRAELLRSSQLIFETHSSSMRTTERPRYPKGFAI